MKINDSICSTLVRCKHSPLEDSDSLLVHVQNLIFLGERRLYGPCIATPNLVLSCDFVSRVPNTLPLLLVLRLRGRAGYILEIVKSTAHIGIGTKPDLLSLGNLYPHDINDLILQFVGPSYYNTGLCFSNPPANTRPGAAHQQVDRHGSPVELIFQRISRN